MFFSISLCFGVIVNLSVIMFMCVCVLVFNWISVIVCEFANLCYCLCVLLFVYMWLKLCKLRFV